MHTVTSQTWNHWLLREAGVRELPRPGSTDWLHEIANGSLKMHSMATQTVVHQQLMLILFFIQENVFVNCAVTTRAPGGKLLLVA